jgi:hypothetical protein
VPCCLGPLDDGFREICEVLEPDPFLRRFLDRWELCLDCLDAIEFRLPSEMVSASPKHLILICYNYQVSNRPIEAKIRMLQEITSSESSDIYAQ